MIYQNEDIKSKAISKGYSIEDIDAAFEYYNRKERNCHPPGEFDSADRFYADERTEYMSRIRSPSRRFPYSEMTAARSAEHCAQVFNATPLHVKRIYRVIRDVKLCEEEPDRQSDIISKMKFSTRVQIEEPKRERFVNLEVTKPQPRRPVISDKKPLNPLKEVSSLGFKPMKLMKNNDQILTVSAYTVDAGYIILSSQDEKPLTLSTDLSLTFSAGLRNEKEKVIVDDCKAMSKKEFCAVVCKAIDQYSNSENLSS